MNPYSMAVGPSSVLRVQVLKCQIFTCNHKGDPRYPVIGTFDPPTQVSTLERRMLNLVDLHVAGAFLCTRSHTAPTRKKDQMRPKEGLSGANSGLLLGGVYGLGKYWAREYTRSRERLFEVLHKGRLRKKAVQVVCKMWEL